MQKVNDIIDRISGYSDYSMVKYCRSLLSVMSQKKEVKTGRGTKVEISYDYKYIESKDMLPRIEKSLAHYTELHKSGGTKVEYRSYQKDIIESGCQILKEHGFLYLAMEVRTGKTLTSLGIADCLSTENVLFITKKKAISSIVDDYQLLMPQYTLCVINYESMHTINSDMHWDLIICDEAHGMGAFPKPSQRAVSVRDLIAKHKSKVIFLSGTPTPESYSQMYHQVYGIPTNPFREYSNFYKFAEHHVKIKQKNINGLFIKDYSGGNESIIEAMQPYTINYSQSEAGFLAETVEEILEVELKESTYRLINRLKRDLIVEGKEEVILADTPVKLMMKIHQLCSGTVKFESGNSMIVDLSKAEFIKEQFEGCKIGIFYKFKEEYNALKQVFGDELTTELPEFESTHKNIALQIVSGREGISLKKAEYLVYYNIDFSATSYWQSKDRMTTKERLENQVFWVFAKGGIEHEIYKAVTKKKDYTINHFKKDFYTNK